MSDFRALPSCPTSPPLTGDQQADAHILSFIRARQRLLSRTGHTHTHSVSVCGGASWEVQSDRTHCESALCLSACFRCSSVTSQVTWKSQLKIGAAGSASTPVGWRNHPETFIIVLTRTHKPALRVLKVICCCLNKCCLKISQETSRLHFLKDVPHVCTCCRFTLMETLLTDVQTK